MKAIAADELMEHELRTCRLHHKLLADGSDIAGIIIRLRCAGIIGL